MSPSERLPSRHLLLALAVVAIWGSNFVVIKLALGALPPLLFAPLRFAFALLPAVFFLPRPAVPWGNLAAYGLLIGVGQFGVLYLADKLLHFSTLGLSWVMNRDNFLLYTAVIFLLFKNDKSVGLVLTGLWLILNFGLITALLGTMSAYLLPVALLVVGGILYLVSTR